MHKAVWPTHCEVGFHENSQDIMRSASQKYCQKIFLTDRRGGGVEQEMRILVLDKEETAIIRSGSPWQNHPRWMQHRGAMSGMDGGWNWVSLGTSRFKAPACKTYRQSEKEQTFLCQAESRKNTWSHPLYGGLFHTLLSFTKQKFKKYPI